MYNYIYPHIKSFVLLSREINSKITKWSKTLPFVMKYIFYLFLYSFLLIWSLVLGVIFLSTLCIIYIYGYIYYKISDYQEREVNRFIERMRMRFEDLHQEYDDRGI